MKLPFLALACTLAVTVYGQDTPHLHNDNRVTEELGPQLRIVGGQQASPGDYPFYGTKSFSVFEFVPLFLSLL